jgi:hypothetical protein
MHSEKSWVTAFGIISGFATITSLIWQMVTTTGSIWPWWLLLLALLSGAAAVTLWQPAVRLKWRVRTACVRVKKDAQDTIDVAAGDCSWLPAELEAFRKKVQQEGVKLRLLCQPPRSEEARSALAELASWKGVEIKQYSEKADPLYLRCIIVDRARLQSEVMLLLDKVPDSHSATSLINVPDNWRRNQMAFAISGSSRTFHHYVHLFNRLFDEGVPLADLRCNAADPKSEP